MNLQNNGLMNYNIMLNEQRNFFRFIARNSMTSYSNESCEENKFFYCNANVEVDYVVLGETPVF